MAVEVVGICYSIEREHQHTSAKLSEQGVSVELEIPAVINLNNIMKSKHDPMVKVLGCVKSEQCVSQYNGVVRKRYRKWIKVETINTIDSVHEITHHYLTVIYAEQYLNGYDQVMQNLKKEPKE